MIPPPSVSEGPQTSPSIPPSPFRARSSQFRSYIAKRRWWLWVGVVLVLIAMVIGIIFAAHKYYVSFGGQGFLKAREEPLGQPTLFLPLRPIQYEEMGTKRANVPYYACGDQLHSCKAFNEPVSIRHIRLTL